MNINMPIFYVALLSIAIVSIVIGKQLSKKKTTVDQYFLSNRNLKLMPLTLTFLATQLGGGAILGGAQAAQTHGFYAIYYSLGISIGLVILALGIGAKFRKLEVATIPEIFGKVYNSALLQRFAAVTLIITTFFILVALGVATKQFFTALGITNPLWFVVFWIVIIFYTTAGGFGAVVKTDIIQVLFILTTFLLIFLFGLLKEGGLYIAKISSFSAVSVSEGLPWFSWLLMPMLFTVIGQDMGQRCFAAKNPKLVSKATAIAAVLLVAASVVPVGLGVLSTSLDTDINNASALIQIVELVSNPVIASLFACSILLAILSTADSLICAISSNISYDLLSSFKKLKSETTKSRLAKISTLIIGTLAVVYSLWFDVILDIMVLAYSLAVSTLFVPVFFGVISKNRIATPAVLSMAFSLIVFIGLTVFYPTEYRAVICLLCALAGYGLGNTTIASSWSRG